MKKLTSVFRRLLYNTLALLPLASHINPSHFKIINWPPPDDVVEYFIANTEITVSS